MAKLRTFEWQEKLPRLPVAPLVPTLNKYLKTVRPLLTDEQLENTKRIVEDFGKPGGLGEKLHHLLLERAKNSKTHWLEEWWDHYAYFAIRDPIAFNVNYYFSFDSCVPNERSQVQRAANLIRGGLEFRRLLDSEELEPDSVKGVPRDMSAFRWMFNTCRIPRLNSDYLKRYTSREAAHVLVVRRGRYFYFDVEFDGVPLEEEQIQTQLERIIDQSKGLPGAPSLGVLTADNRDQWTKIRELVLTNKTNEASLEKLQSAAFVVCLDEEIPKDRHETARALWHGDARNRWFDKSIQLIVFPDGTYGLNGEHSKLDGMPTHRFGEFLATYNTPKSGARRANLPIPKELEFRFTPQVLREIEDSARRFESLAKDFELHAFVFQDYGKKFIQQHNLSPDAYFQVALNWTYQRMIGRLCATYESASTKKFMNGRTEVGRTCTVEAAEWINSMNSLVASPREKQELLRRACQAHTDYMKEAVENLGVDRLLLGLKLIARENGFEEHPIFRDVSYTLSTHWNLSTSQLSSPYFFVGFGPVVPDGFGVCYCLRGSSICASITSFSTHPLTRTTRFAQELAKSFLHMKIVLETKTEASL